MQSAQLAEGIELDPVMEREREARLEAIKARLLALVAEGRGAEAIDASVATMLELERECERLSWRLLRAERYRFGHQSEKLSRKELEALARGLGASASEAAVEQPQVPTPTPPTDVDSTMGAGEQGAQPAAPPANAKKPRNRKKGGSTVIGSKVERDVTRVAVQESERCCGLCGREKSPMPPVVHETMEFVPAKIVLRVQEREQLSCSSCRKDVVVAAPVTPVTGRRIAPSLLAKLIADKCEMSLPLDRQRQELKRLGADMPEQTIASCWAYALDLLEPVAVATFSETLACKVVGADDSHLRTLLNGPGSVRGHLWCFVGTDGTVGGQERVAYGYTETWEAGQIQGWFAAIDGDVQVDGYAGYAAKVETDDGQQTTAVPDERRLGCMMHVRSKFHAALLAKDKRAAVPLEKIGRLYEIESECRRLGLDAEGRGRVRAERSIPILDALDSWVDETHARLVPKSPLRVATTYQTNQRPFVRRCFEDGRYEIDNGRTERRIRTFAVGRRVYLFTGSVRGGERLATAYTLTENCKIRGIDPRVYLEDVLTKLMNGWPVRRLSELTPHRWVPDHAGDHREEQPPAPG